MDANYLNKIKDELIYKIKNNFDVSSIILFGSYAHGQPTENSDLDLLVILDDESFSKTYMEKIQKRLNILKCLGDMGDRIPIDLLVYTNSEWKKLLENGGSFIEQINTKGVRIL
ncbi:MAG: nucleotidyltransferase domain-containing protein, partial [Oligoflexia bacterium]|nr:nucleotidyltransferase domain-containing protein [Oligoflexia bacterium]